MFYRNQLMEYSMTTNEHTSVSFIIGATGGIGSVVSRRLHALGHRLLLFSRNTESLHALQQLLPGSISFPGNAESSEDLAAAVTRAEEHFGKIDNLIHAVGSILLKPLHLTSEEQFRQTLDRNLVSPFLAMKAVLPGMIRHTSGSVIVCSSVAGSTGLKNHEAIAAAKGGLNAMIRSAAITYAKQNIRCNAVAFGLIDTPLSSPITKNPSSLATSNNLHPLGRIGTADEAADMIIHLASDSSRWITGQIFSVDGGLSAGR